jgi:hypothetical protein
VRALAASLAVAREREPARRPAVPVRLQLRQVPWVQEGQWVQVPPVDWVLVLPVLVLLAAALVLAKRAAAQPVSAQEGVVLAVESARPRSR